MIQIKNAEQLKTMRAAGRIAAEALALAGEAVREGITTKHLDTIIRTHIEKCGATPSFLGYSGFPGSACISINDEVIHGIPSEERRLKEGDIVKIDVGAYYKGFHGDCAATFGVGKISKEAETLITATRESFFRGIAQAKPGNRIGDIGSAIESYLITFGFSVIRKYVGHGVGAQLHEAPDVPNYGTPGRGPRIFAGQTLAIEPMVSAGGYEVYEADDGWTVRTVDHSLTAHYEHSVAITEEGVIILTRLGDDMEPYDGNADGLR
ncbi:MAG TPA: type I methionyl aminopeptidase [Bacillota bacterium]|nr:type I methionyl aminopeptidase [Bacillota bacterium]